MHNCSLTEERYLLCSTQVWLPKPFQFSSLGYTMFQMEVWKNSSPYYKPREQEWNCSQTGHQLVYWFQTNGTTLRGCQIGWCIFSMHLFYQIPTKRLVRLCMGRYILGYGVWRVTWYSQRHHLEICFHISNFDVPQWMKQMKKCMFFLSLL